MSWISANEEQKKRLHTVFYEKRNLFGRDRLHNAYKTAYPEDPLSQRAVLDWLKAQPVHNKFQRHSNRSAVRPFNVQQKGYLAIDLVDMSSNEDNGYVAIMTCIDLYTRYAYAIPIRDKTSKSVIKSLKEIFKDNPQKKITSILADYGGEFRTEFTEFLEKLGIKRVKIPPNSPWQNSIVERFNATLSRLIFQNMDVSGNKRWVVDLPKLVSNYNNTKSVSTKKTPTELENAPDDSEVHADAASVIRNRNAKKYKGQVEGKNLKIGDIVRKVNLPNLNSRIFKASREGYFEDQLYRVYQINGAKFKQRLPTYSLETLKGDRLPYTYPRWQIMQVNEEVPDEDEVEEVEEEIEDEPLPRQSLRNTGVYEVERIIDKRKVKGKVQYLVKWTGYSHSDNTWEPKSNLKDAKDAIKSFEDNT